MNPNLEERTEECIWYMVARNSADVERYQKCYNCSGLDKTKNCYVSNKWFHEKMKQSQRGHYEK